MARRGARLALPLGLVLILAAVTPAHAHKLKVFATADGATIDGRVYFVGGAAAPGARIAIEAPPGTPIASLVADADGAFRYEATRRVDHLFAADTGDGHSARFTIAAQDLPSALPPGPSPVQAADPLTDPIAPETHASTDGVSLPPSATALRAMLSEAVASQVRPLRQQMNDYEDQLRLRDIVGGIGYIVGLAGVALWMKARQRPQIGR
ncbi:MAG: hypothetical protein U1E42_06675 [Rhodospirillales bacterium]